jgi:fibro-slime domain-containing protein
MRTPNSSWGAFALLCGGGVCACGGNTADTAGTDVLGAAGVANGAAGATAPGAAGASGVPGAGSPTGASGSSSGDVGGLDVGGFVPAPGPTPEEIMAQCEPNLTGLVRDFRGAEEPMGHPDFETFSGGSESPGIVQPLLGADLKPQYAPAGALVDPENDEQTTTKANYDQWYRDTPGVNQSIEFLVPLMPGATPGILTFADNTFFPIDGMGFGNTPGEDHNFHFTFELHTTFAYTGGEVFTFTGDDDLWVFINGHLAIDLGGLHPQVTDTVSLDENATAFGITVGNTYPLDLFHAERHTSESNFRIDTSIAFTNCNPIIIR